jgi:hypothetical protein
MKIRRTLTGLLILLGLIGVLDTLLLFLFSGGVNLGTILPGVLGGLLILTGSIKFFWRKLMPLRKTRPWVFKVRRGVISLALIALSSFVVVEVGIICNSRPDPVVEVDYLIILGAGLNGEQLSWTLQERMQKGLGYLEGHPQVKVVLSGGKVLEKEFLKRKE